MKKPYFKIISLIFLFTFSIFAFTGCDDENDRRQREEEELQKQQEAHWNSPEGKAESARLEAEKKAEEEHAALSKKYQEKHEFDEKLKNNPLGTIADMANQKVYDVFHYEDPEQTPKDEIIEIFKIGSDLAVDNGGKNATVTLNNAVYATELWTYHYNYGKGAPGGTILMKAEGGTVYGPWQVEVKNSFYWVATLNQTIPAGKYTIIDSDPATWSQNGDTAGQGMTWMMGMEK